MLENPYLQKGIKIAELRAGRRPLILARLAAATLPIVNIPSQTTVLTRRVLDDKNATSIGDALRTTPGVTVGR
jgi:outer membrane receptor protein involved in Fe transport